jgi:hypothetical protein
MRLTALSNSSSIREDISSSASDCALSESTAIDRKLSFACFGLREPTGSVLNGTYLSLSS